MSTNQARTRSLSAAQAKFWQEQQNNPTNSYPAQQYMPGRQGRMVQSIQQRHHTGRAHLYGKAPPAALNNSALSSTSTLSQCGRTQEHHFSPISTQNYFTKQSPNDSYHLNSSSLPLTPSMNASVPRSLNGPSSVGPAPVERRSPGYCLSSSLPHRSISVPPSAFSSCNRDRFGGLREYDSDPEPDSPPASGAENVLQSGMYPGVRSSLGYTPAQSKLWADYLCNADTPFSYSATVHHPEHFNYVPAHKHQQPVASQNGAMVAKIGGNASEIAFAKVMSKPMKNKRCSATAGFDAHATAISNGPSPSTVVGGRRTVKRQRRVAQQNAENITQYHNSQASVMELDDI